MQRCPALDAAIRLELFRRKSWCMRIARVADESEGANIVTLYAQVTSLEPSGETLRVGLRIGDEVDAQD